MTLSVSFFLPPVHVQWRIFQHVCCFLWGVGPNGTVIIVIIIIINLIYIPQFNTNGILTALYIVITYIQNNAIYARMNLHETII